MIGLDLISICAPQVAPTTIAAIIRVESGGNTLAIGINGPLKLPYRPTNISEAAQLARNAMQSGYSVDLGLMQINSRNLPGLGLTVEQVFDPCTNIRAGASILTRGYLGAAKQLGPGQDALKAAISTYNTGNYQAGFRNGYVAKVYRSSDAARLRLVIQPIQNINMAYPTGKAQPNPYSADSTVYIKPIQQPITTRSNHDQSSAETHASNPFAEPG